MMKLSDIRSKFLSFFEHNGHKIVPSSSLIPHQDPSLMFTNAGMVQFKDIFLGNETREYKRATTSQKCLRAGGKHNDLENVGYTKRHLTFFEMLGNFSFGDYFKEQAIEYAWNFVVNELKLDKSRLYFTVYHEDEDAFKLWKKISGFDDSRIIKISTKDNFWSMGDTGPCGPCTEIFYDQGSQLEGGLPGTPTQDGDRYVEIWNLVFMQYEQMAGGHMEKLKAQSVDTGMGLERITAVMQGVYDNFEIDLFKKIINASAEISGAPVDNKSRISHRIIADHLRSCSFLIAEGVMPSNEGRGYVLRRILRRAIRHVRALGYKQALMHQLVPVLESEMSVAYPELKQHKALIERTLKAEEESFRASLESGILLLNSEAEKISGKSIFPGDVAFKLHDTYGFPIDLTIDILKERNITVDLESFDQCMFEQKRLSRQAWSGSGEKEVGKLWFDVKNKAGTTEFVGYDSLKSQSCVVALVQDNQLCDAVENEDEFFLIADKTPFFGESGGQAGDIGKIEGKAVVLDTIIPIKDLHVHKCKTTGNRAIKVGDKIELVVDQEHRCDVKRNHTATHLLHAVLSKKLGAVQKGSSVKCDGFRFDFNYAGQIAREVLNEIEVEINSMILKNLKVVTTIMSHEESIKTGATALFGEKYDQEVRVVCVGDQTESCSMELCKGTHVEALGEIGLVKIISEESIASGVRRIEARSGREAFKYFQKTFDELKSIGHMLQSEDDEVGNRIQAVVLESKQLNKQLSVLKQQMFAELLRHEKSETYGDAKAIFINSQDADASDVRGAVQQFISSSKSVAVFVLNKAQGKMFYTIGVGSDLHKKFGADDMGKILTQLGGKGGGNKLLAQGSIDMDANKIKQSLIDALLRF